MFELMAQSPTFFIGMTFVVSLLVGSFLNVVIYRLPIMMQRQWQQEAQTYIQDSSNDSAQDLAQSNATATDSSAADTPFNLIKPDSTCPHCQHKIRAWENIPVISWLLLRAKCSQCKAPISIRYPSVELLTAILSTVVAYQLGYTAQGLGFIVVTWMLVAMTFIDFDTMLLPDTLTLPMLWLGLLISIFSNSISPQDAIVGAALGYLSLYTVYWGFKLVTGKEGMGYGDFKLLAAIGAWVGWQHLGIVILLSSLVGAIVGVGLMLVKRQQGSLAIPFGPYLAAAGWLTMLYGDAIADWYLRTLV